MLLNKTDSETDATKIEGQGQAPSSFRTVAWCLVGTSRYCLIYFVSVSGMAQAQEGRVWPEGRGGRGREGQPGGVGAGPWASLALAPESAVALAKSLLT